MSNQKPKDPNWVATFSMKRNPEKQPGDRLPDFISVDSDKVNQKTGKPYRKNFTINGVWHEPAGWIQQDKSLKITIKKSAPAGEKSSQPDAADWDDQF